MSRSLVCLVCAVLLAVATQLPAQPPATSHPTASPSEAGGTVSGNGTVVLKLKPDRLRMQVQLESHGKSVEAALDRLKTRREAALKKLIELKADKDSIVISNPAMSKFDANNGPMAVPGGPGMGVPMNPGVPMMGPPGVMPAPNWPPPPGTTAPGPAMPPPTYAPAGSEESQPDSSVVPGPVQPAPTLQPVRVEKNTSSSAPVKAVPAVQTVRRMSGNEAGAIVGSAPATTVTSPAVAVPRAGAAGAVPAIAPAQVQPAAPAGTEKPARLYTVSATLTAEWTLDGESFGRVLAAGEALQEKIKAADVAGVNRPDKLSDEEQNLLDQMPQQGNGNVTYTAPAIAGPFPMPGQRVIFQPAGQTPSAEPMFLYIARVKPDERKKALAEAFSKAKAVAAELAEAAGAKQGPVVSLSREVLPYSSTPAYDSPLQNVELNERDVTDVNPNLIKIFIRVSADFRLQ
jgi:uncharacterized protein YggE